MSTPADTVKILLDAGLGLRAEQFAAAWNGSPEHRTQAAAGVAADAAAWAAKSYDPTWAEIVNLVVAPLALGVAGNALYDLIKRALLGAGVRRRTRIEQHRLPDGSELIVVTIEEEA